PMASNTSRSCRASAAGPERSSPPISIRAMRPRRWASSMPCPICQTRPRRAARSMSSRYLRGAILAAALWSGAAAAQQQPLRVCADPNNLPFSNAAGQGFENHIAELVAQKLQTHVEYTWWAQRRGFIRNTLRQKTCDIVIGVPTGFAQALTTRPYYRSHYVFVSRTADGPAPHSLDDPVLKQKVIGVPLIGDDGANAPPAHGLTRRGIVGNVRGFMVYGDYRDPAPSARIVEAVADRSIDIAIVW